jgi:hypothetical protein
MEHAMGVVEEDFAENHAREDIEDNLYDGWKTGVEAKVCFATSEAAEREQQDM